jgi:hypothetical protein
MMATYTVTTSPVALDTTGAIELAVTNTGTESVYVNTRRLRPGQRGAFDAAQVLLASTQTGTSTVETATSVAAAPAAPIPGGGIVPGLRAFHAALAGRYYAPCRIVGMGASTFQGEGSTVWGRDILNRLTANLRTRYPVPGIAGGPGMIPAMTPQAGSLITQYPTVLSGGATTVNAASTTTDRFKVWSSPALTRGAHTVTVTWATGGITYVRGFIGYDQDEAAGIHMYNGAKAGVQSTDMEVEGPQWSYGIAYAQPALVLIDLGRNDYYWNPQGTSANLRTRLLSIIATLKSNTTVDPSIVLHMTQKVGGSVVGAEPWSNYRAVYEGIAAADPTVTVFDLGLRQDEPQTTNALGLYQSDLQHMTDKGHANAADHLAAFLSPR